MTSTYEVLLKKTESCKMEVGSLTTLCIEISETLNDLNPPYMKEIFKQTENRSSDRFSNNLYVPKVNQVRYGSNSLRSLGPKIWNNLPEYIKSAETLSIFKKNIKTWNGPTCNCKMCEYLGSY